MFQVPRIFPMTHPHDCDPTFRGVVPISQVRDLSLRLRCLSYYLEASDGELCFDPMSDSKLILFLQPQFLDRDGNFDGYHCFIFLHQKCFSKIRADLHHSYSEVK